MSQIGVINAANALTQLALPLIDSAAPSVQRKS